MSGVPDRRRGPADRRSAPARTEALGAGTLRPGRRVVPVETEAQLARRYGHIAGFLFIAVWLFSVPSMLLLDPVPWLAMSVLAALGIGTGLVCLAIPWERISPAWLHALPVAATVQVAAVVAWIDPVYGANYFFVALFVGFVFQTRRAIVAHLALVSVAVCAPLVYDPGSTEQLRTILLLLPALNLTGAVVAYLRERLEANQRTSREFADQALEIALRLGGEEAVEAESRAGSR
jgi:hypothetical protein